MGFRRRPRFPEELTREAAGFPGGWVYEIDPRFDRDGAVPYHGIRRGWEVGPDGTPTGKFTDNPEYGNRVPLTDLGQIVADALAYADGATTTVLVADDLSLNGRPVEFDAGIAAVVDRLQQLGFAPADTGWTTEIPGGRRYTFRRTL